MWRRPIATITGYAEGRSEPTNRQSISTAQRTRSRVRLFGSRSMLSFIGMLPHFCRLGEAGFDALRFHGTGRQAIDKTRLAPVHQDSIRRRRDGGVAVLKFDDAFQQVGAGAVV